MVHMQGYRNGGAEHKQNQMKFTVQIHIKARQSKASVFI